jgi:hypothetical protein
MLRRCKLSCWRTSFGPVLSLTPPLRRRRAEQACQRQVRPRSGICGALERSPRHPFSWLIPPSPSAHATPGCSAEKGCTPFSLREGEGVTANEHSYPNLAFSSRSLSRMYFWMRVSPLAGKINWQPPTVKSKFLTAQIKRVGRKVDLIIPRYDPIRNMCFHEQTLLRERREGRIAEIGFHVEPAALARGELRFEGVIRPGFHAYNIWGHRTVPVAGFIPGGHSELLDRQRATADSIMLNHEDRAGDYVIGHTFKEVCDSGLGFSL